MVVINRCWLIMWRHQMTYVGAVTSRSPMYRSCSSSCYRKLLRAKPQNFAPTVSISYLLSCATERYRLAVLLYTLTMLLHNLRCATCFSQLHSKCSGQGRNHRWVGGGGGSGPPTFWRTPNFWHNVFVGGPPSRQQSEFGVWYRRRKEEEILPVIIAGINVLSAFYRASAHWRAILI